MSLLNLLLYYFSNPPQVWIECVKAQHVVLNVLMFALFSKHRESLMRNKSEKKGGKSSEWQRCLNESSLQWKRCRERKAFAFLKMVEEKKLFVCVRGCEKKERCM